VKVNSLNDLYLEQLKDSSDAEQQLIKALPAPESKFQIGCRRARPRQTTLALGRVDFFLGPIATHPS
jgi:hypothetical protein